MTAIGVASCSVGSRFAYFRERPLQTPTVTIDSAGLRVTPPTHHTGGKPLRVWFFGGSTTWGWEERDGFTRPADVGRLLAAAGFDPTITNFGQPGYTSAQEYVALMVELRRGNRPDVVVFWDGGNDIPDAVRNGRPGVTGREFDRVADAEFMTTFRIRGEVVGSRVLLRSLAQYSALAWDMLNARDGQAPLPPLPDPVAFCRSLMGDWASQARGNRRGRTRIRFRRAHRLATAKWETSARPKSAWEHAVLTSPTFAWRAGDDRLGAHHIECARVADSLAHVVPSIINWARMHSNDTATVYVDPYGHTTERATAIEADSLAVEIVRRLRR